MDARLLALVCSGTFQDLESFLDGQDQQAAAAVGGSATRRPPGDDEEAFLRESLLDGVTVGGDTVLHVVATNGDSQDFLKKASLVHTKARSLLYVQNNDGDTPLHCAAREGSFAMASRLIDLARGGDDANANRVKALLRTENKIKWTALHEAIKSVPVGHNDIVELLMKEDSQLASFPKDGTSPLYLAILEGRSFTAETLYELSSGVLSYSGPNGQNALHAAVLRGKVDKKKISTVSYACKNATLSWILNMQDKNGNTALHLAVKAGSVKIFCCLFRNRQVQLNLTNKKGETPLDIAYQNIPKGLHAYMHSEARILSLLQYAGAKRGIRHLQDYLEQSNIVQKKQGEIDEMEKVKDATQSLCIGSVLIATVTFGAAFAMPGGYRADDHTNGGTPTLAGSYKLGCCLCTGYLYHTSSACS
ncbi:hypothetical protein CFC21_090489 [Triticum aestivum]|uniref:PGG domain-containing protein n=2 Tax=Triticum aestivum TaxID=4565 RepID=A0A9R1LEF2_WHEAT|nr:hypothetical protein CFC21_090489 [Triticum aestivum]